LGSPQQAVEAIGAWTMDALAVLLNVSRPGPRNPDLPCTLEEAKADLRRMAANPVKLARPVLVLGAYHAWAPVPWALARKIRRLTGAGEREVVCVPYLWETTLHAAAAKGARTAIGAWGLAPGGASVPVDVVGISMGGLVARMVAAGERAGLGLPWDLPRIDARRIFTFGSPLRGAKAALRLCPDRAARDMCPGSALLGRLEAEAARDIELICYGQLRDQIVGATRTAPEGMDPIWTGGTLVFSHFATPHNPWFLADMARRLRGEEPLWTAGSKPPRD
jgi:hypothetical protein